MLQTLLVGLIVIGAAVYSAWALMPATTRRRLALKGAQLAGGTSTSGWRGRVARVLSELAQASGGGCDDCTAHESTPAERAARNGNRR
jgi:alkylhydroperoxidase family enzyme